MVFENGSLDRRSTDLQRVLHGSATRRAASVIVFASDIDLLGLEPFITIQCHVRGETVYFPKPKAAFTIRRIARAFISREVLLMVFIGFLLVPAKGLEPPSRRT